MKELVKLLRFWRIPSWPKKNRKSNMPKEKQKGKKFEIKVGDKVFKKQMKNLSRKGGKMEPLGIGPYRWVL